MPIFAPDMVAPGIPSKHDAGLNRRVTEPVLTAVPRVSFKVCFDSFIADFLSDIFQISFTLIIFLLSLLFSEGFSLAQIPLISSTQEFKQTLLQRPAKHHCHSTFPPIVYPAFSHLRLRILPYFFRFPIPRPSTYLSIGCILAILNTSKIV